MEKIVTENPVVKKIFTPKNMIYLGILMLVVAAIETPFYGYTTIVNYYFKFLEEPMDLVTFGVMLVGIGVATQLFFKHIQKFETRLGLLTLFLTIFARIFWEINWVTGAYLPSVYVWYSLKNNVSPIYQQSLWSNNVGSAWPTLDLITNTSYHMSVVLPIFGIATAAVIIIILSIVLDWKATKRN